jgi:hypothetical protein
LSAAEPGAVVQRQEWPEEEELMMRRDRAIPTIQRQDIPEEEELLLRSDRALPTIQRQDAEEEEWVSARGKEPLPSLQLQIEEEEEEELLQPSRSPGADAVGVSSDSGPDGLRARLGLARGGGQALDPTVQGSYERAFGHDFSRVHIHTNTEADALAGRLHAEAFTTGEDIFFRAGRYHPQSEAGRFLLAHELTHVVQQSE